VLVWLLHPFFVCFGARHGATSLFLVQSRCKSPKKNPLPGTALISRRTSTVLQGLVLVTLVNHKAVEIDRSTFAEVEPDSTFARVHLQVLNTSFSGYLLAVLGLNFEDDPKFHRMKFLLFPEISDESFYISCKLSPEISDESFYLIMQLGKSLRTNIKAKNHLRKSSNRVIIHNRLSIRKLKVISDGGCKLEPYYDSVALAGCTKMKNGNNVHDSSPLKPKNMLS
jgi:hypothetical protein